MTRFFRLLLLMSLAACGTSASDDDGGPMSCPALGDEIYPQVTSPCTPEVLEPGRLAITTTDFGTGALSMVDVTQGTVQADVLLATTDSTPLYHDGSLYLVHRFGNNAVERYDAISFDAQGSFAIDAAGTPNPNPHGLAFDAEQRAYLTLLDHAGVQVHDFTRAPGSSLLATVDLTDYADADGKPEASLAFACGDVVFVSIQRLHNFASTDCDFLVPISAGDAPAAGAAIALLGTWAKQVRLDRADDTQRTVLVLTSGIERVNLSTAEVSWAVPAEVFEAEGLGPFNLAAFDVTDDGERAYLTATSPDFSETKIWRVGLSAPHALEEVAGGLTVVERTLEIVGSTLWVADRTPATEGIRRWDLSQQPPAEIGQAADLGLPPYSMLAIP